MATTVFPQTDDTVTRTAWQSLNTTINRGDDNGTADSNTYLLKYNQITTGDVSANTVVRQGPTVSLSAGQMYYVRGCLTLAKPVADTTDDRCTAGIYLGTGIKIYLAHIVNRALEASLTDFLTIEDEISTSGNTGLRFQIRGTNNVTFTDKTVLWVDMIAVCEQDSSMYLSYTKTEDDNSTWYQADGLSFLEATPIQG